MKYLLIQDKNSLNTKLLELTPEELAQFFWNFVQANPWLQINHPRQFVDGVEQKVIIGHMYGYLKDKLQITDFPEEVGINNPKEYIRNKYLRSRIKKKVQECFESLQKAGHLLVCQSSLGEILLFNEKSTCEDFQKAFQPPEQSLNPPARSSSNNGSNNNNNNNAGIENINSQAPDAQSLSHQKNHEKELNRLRVAKFRNQPVDPLRVKINFLTGNPLTMGQQRGKEYYHEMKMRKLRKTAQTKMSMNSSQSAQLLECSQSSTENPQTSSESQPSSRKRTLESDSFTSPDDKRTKSVSEGSGVLQQSNPTLNAPVESAAMTRIGTASSNGLFSQQNSQQQNFSTPLLSLGNLDNSRCSLSYIMYRGIIPIGSLMVKKPIENQSQVLPQTELESQTRASFNNQN